MSKLSFRARALDASKPMPIYLAEELPDLPDYSAINRAVPQMPSGMEKEEESEHHLQRAISGSGLIIPTPEVCEVSDLQFYERCYPPDYKMPKQHIHMQPLWEEQEAPEYDIDSEDERWLKQQRHPELTELLFEQMMDKLEKCSGQTVVTLSEAKLLLERKDDLVIAVYDYWLNKRLNTQHPLILSVKTESRPGQSSNNPYLAFRRRTEKMQTRKNRKNDESSYEKMLKLRRDLARALTLLQMVARREEAKRDLVRLTAQLAGARYAAQDFTNHVPDPPPRVGYTASIAAARREPFPPRPLPPTPDHTRQREKRPYKRRKHRHQTPAAGAALRESGCTSSEEESLAASLGEASASPPHDGPFAFRRKPGCFYQMPTSTLCGDPVDPADPAKEGLYQHEVDVRHRYTLTSLSTPWRRCVGFARRRVCRGGRVALDRISTPLDDLWPNLPFKYPASNSDRKDRDEEVELETKAHRSPKEMSRDYHTSGRYPWRHAFRKHLAKHPHLWTIDDCKPDPDDCKPASDDCKLAVDDCKLAVDDCKLAVDDYKLEPEEKMNIDIPQDSDISVRTVINSDSEVTEVVQVDRAVRDNLDKVVRKRSWSGCSEDSYESDDSLQPVEKEFENFIDEVDKKWLHFRPKTPPRSPPPDDLDPGLELVTTTTPLEVELRCPDYTDPFITKPFSLSQLFTELPPAEADTSTSSADITDELLTDNFTGLTEAQMESILCEADLKALDAELKERRIAEDILDELVRDVGDKESFLCQGQGLEGRVSSGGRRKQAAEPFGSSVVSISADSDAIYVDKMETKVEGPATPPKKVETPKQEKIDRQERERERAQREREQREREREKEKERIEREREKDRQEREKEKERERERLEKMQPSPVPNSKIIVEEVNEVPHLSQMKLEKKKSQDTIEEVQLAHGVQLKTIQTKHSPLKKHIITSAAARRSSASTVTPSAGASATGGAVASGASVNVGALETVTVSAAHQPTDNTHPHILTVAVSDSLKVRVQSPSVSAAVGGGGAAGPGPSVVGLVGNGPFAHHHLALALPLHARDQGSVSTAGTVQVSTPAGIRRGGPLVHLTTTHKPVHVHAAQSQPLVVASIGAPSTPPSLPTVSGVSAVGVHAVPHNKLKVLHAHPLTPAQRTHLIAANRGIGQLPAVVSLATLGEGKGGAALLKAAPGALTQLIEIKGTQLAKGPHLVNVVRQPQPGKTTMTRIELGEAKKRQVVATLEGGAIKGGVQQAARPHRLGVSLDGRPLVRAALPAGTVRAAAVRQQVQVKGRVAAAPHAQHAKHAPASLVAGLVHNKTLHLPKGGQKIAISGAGVASVAGVGPVSLGVSHMGHVTHAGHAGHAAVSAGAPHTVSALALSAAQLKARQPRLLAHARPKPIAEIVEASPAPATNTGATSSTPGSGEAPLEPRPPSEGAPNGGVRARPTDTLPMEVT